MSVKINVRINGDSYELAVNTWQSINEVLRENLNLTGTKLGCESGNCGVCTIIIDGKAVNSCLVLAVEVNGSDILTVEGLTNSKNMLHPIQEAFIKKGAIQCGFCTPGMEMSAFQLLSENEDPTESEVRTAISGNLCRCTGYTKIVGAVIKAKTMILRKKKATKNG